ncbi:MAG: hypothetical protein QM713_05570 [Arachnia sp.]
MADPADQALAPTAQEDAAKLLDFVGGFAMDMLTRHKSFAPCGAAIDLDGQIVQIAAAPDGFDDTRQLYEFMVDQALGQASDWRAVCFALDTVNADYGDAVQFNLDFRDHPTGLITLLPYKPGGLWRKAQFGEAIHQTWPSFFFDSSANGSD